MIKHEEKYKQWITDRGVGKNDIVASSIKSYISYLQSVSKLIGEDISEKNLRDSESIDRIAKRIAGMRADKTIKNYISAMKQYVEMVKFYEL